MLGRQQIGTADSVLESSIGAHRRWETGQMPAIGWPMVPTPYDDFAYMVDN